ncbi:hypothetical protein SRO_3634 [Streptomyces rochei]|nr:hypothetical protein SRO_3634 [Streptomyces rochei]
MDTRARRRGSVCASVGPGGFGYFSSGMRWPRSHMPAGVTVWEVVAASWGRPGRWRGGPGGEGGGEDGGGGDTADEGHEVCSGSAGVGSSHVNVVPELRGVPPLHVAHFAEGPGRWWGGAEVRMLERRSQRGPSVFRVRSPCVSHVFDE